MDNYRELKIRCDPGVGHLRPDDTKIRSKKQQNSEKRLTRVALEGMPSSININFAKLYDNPYSI